MSTSSGAGGAHFFEGSSNVQINNSQFFAVSLGAQGNSFEHLRLLDAEVSTNAILNAGGRADPVRCFPGTREPVISKAENWMAVDYQNDRRILWLSGPAGAGKTAIVQTLAENCIERGAPMANFFFFRADTSRHHSSPVVATLLHQLLELFPGLAPIINEIISRNRLVFKKTLQDQFMLLIDEPIRKILHGIPNAPPIILLIDGLDECDSRPDLDSATKSEQTTLLSALHTLVTRHNSPFIALVASRVESHIQTAFNRIGSAANSIYLNEEYQPDKDIHLYVMAELTNIKHTHPLSRYLDATWPVESAIEAIVKKSSGQFIYAATVIRFLANSPQSPAVTMEMVQSIRPAHKHSPFAEIDAIYTFILSRCEHWQSASQIILLDRIVPPFSPILPVLGYTVHDAASFFSDLTSIIKFDIASGMVILSYYHASFSDFISSPERAGNFHINWTGAASSLASRLLLEISDHDTFLITTHMLVSINQTSENLTHALTHLPTKPHDVDWERNGNPDIKNAFLLEIKKLYASHDQNLYKQIFEHMKQQAWIPDDVFFSDLDQSSHSAEKPDELEGEPMGTDQEEPSTQHLLQHLDPPKPKNRNWFSTKSVKRLFR